MCLNMSDYDNRQGSECVSYKIECEITLQVNEYLLRRAYSETWQRFKIEHFGKIIIAFSTKHSILNLWKEFWIGVGF